MKNFLALCLSVLAFSACFGNAGVFLGSGQTPIFEKTSEIQMVEDFYANQNSIRIFCNSLIVKDSHKDTGIQLKNSVLKQAKMLSIY